jgi:hypothetical protein
VSYVHHNAPVVERERDRERERINLYFGANDIRVDSKGSVLFVIFLCVEER